ncbi:hypothetical protein KR093_002387 [Drosophila rubida]|uniref:trypsin n=1 Tax=Drosophila rubida TaxID=30044 RepID=A0AAD4KA35_9MUSC|nr:hypothetical protein KR093_002387 [Drosophila rubida]
MKPTTGATAAALLLTLLLAGGGGQAETQAAQGRILGGEEAANDATPYAVSLRVDNAHVCGACIISETKLLTAAHCLYRDSKLRISGRVGSPNQYAGGQVVAIASYAIHPDYQKLENNLAVITLKTPLQWTTRIQAIELLGPDEAQPAEGAAVSVVGWGTTADGVAAFKIHKINLTLATDAVCLDAYSDHDASKDFCLAHKLKEGTCNGDGGGPAIYNGKLLGVCNFVVGACGSRYPDVFVRTAGYSAWLQEQLLA